MGGTVIKLIGMLMVMFLLNGCKLGKFFLLQFQLESCESEISTLENSKFQIDKKVYTANRDSLFPANMIRLSTEGGPEHFAKLFKKDQRIIFQISSVNFSEKSCESPEACENLKIETEALAQKAENIFEKLKCRKKEVAFKVVEFDRQNKIEMQLKDWYEKANAY